MGSVCIAGGCLDVQTPTKINFVKLQKWAESDAELLKLISLKENPTRKAAQHDEYGHRQRYLRSYTFSRKVTVAEKTKKWFKEKQKNKDEKNACKERLVSGTCCVIVGVMLKCLLYCVVRIDVED